MKYLVKLFFAVTPLLLFCPCLKSQNTKSTVAVKSHPKVTEKGFGSPESIMDVKDVPENNEAYDALKNLVENRVIIVFADNFFSGNASLKRGEFVVSFNSALERIKDATKNAALDTTLVNTYDRNRAYITSVMQVKDVQPASVYYSAVQSLLENWGINAPFTKAALLNANSLFHEDELYDILRVTLGFEHGKVKPARVAVKRSRFAMVLNDALNFKIGQIDALAREKNAREEAEKARVNAVIEQIEQGHRDSVRKEIETRKMEAEKKEAEARRQLENKNK
jgi:hypothetical protein